MQKLGREKLIMRLSPKSGAEGRGEALEEGAAQGHHRAECGALCPSGS